MSIWKNIKNVPNEGDLVIAAWFDDGSLMHVCEAKYLKGRWYSLEEETPRALRVEPTNWMYLGDYYIALQEITRESE